MRKIFMSVLLVCLMGISFSVGHLWCEKHGCCPKCPDKCLVEKGDCCSDKCNCCKDLKKVCPCKGDCKCDGTCVNGKFADSCTCYGKCACAEKK